MDNTSLFGYKGAGGMAYDLCIMNDENERKKKQMIEQGKEVTDEDERDLFLFLKED